MGCFNTVCGISGLTIYSGDRVKMFLMHPKEHYSGCLVQPGDMFQIVSLPICGEINEYGSLASEYDNKGLYDEDVTTRFFGNYYRDRKEEYFCNDENKYRSNITKEDPMLEFVLNVGDGYFCQKTYSNTAKSRGLLYSVVLEEMYEALFFSVYDDVDKTRKSAQDDLQRWAKAILKYQPITKKYNEDNKDNPSSDKEMDYQMRKNENIGFMFASGSLFEDHLADDLLIEEELYGYKHKSNRTLADYVSIDDIRGSEFWKYSDYIDDNFKSGEWTLDSPDWIVMRNALADLVLYVGAMSHSSRSFTPVQIAGQEKDSRGERQFLKKQQEYLEKQMKAWKADGIFEEKEDIK